MPGETGFDLAKSLRATSAVPILMLTARDETEMRIEGLADRRRRLCRQSLSSRANCRCASPISSSARSRDRRRRWNRFASGLSFFTSRAANCATARRSSISPIASARCSRVLAASPGETVPRQALAGSGRQSRRQRTRGRRAGQPAAPQDRARSRQSALRADGARHRLSPGGVAMTSLDTGLAAMRSASGAASTTRADRLAAGWINKRSCRRGSTPVRLLIIIAPMVVLQSVVAFVFMERHWNLVTQRLSAGGRCRHRGLDRRLQRLSAGRRQCADSPHRPGAARPRRRLPARRAKCRRRGRNRSSRCSTRRCRSSCASRSSGRSGSIRSARSALVEIRIQLDNAVMRVFAPRSAAYASNSEIFLLWMVGTSLVLLAVAIALPAQPDHGRS